MYCLCLALSWNASPVIGIFVWFIDVVQELEQCWLNIGTQYMNDGWMDE